MLAPPAPPAPPPLLIKLFEFFYFWNTIAPPKMTGTPETKQFRLQMGRKWAFLSDFCSH